MPETNDVAGEVRRLHDDVAAWLGSDAPREVFERFADALHPDFSMVSLGGDVVGRDELLAGFEQARNARPGLRITVEDITVIAVAGDLTVVRFRERHQGAEGEADRLTTGCLIGAPEPARPLWLSVHETASPAAAS